jgi:hypothetical protein
MALWNAALQPNTHNTLGSESVHKQAEEELEDTLYFIGAGNEFSGSV